MLSKTSKTSKSKVSTNDNADKCNPIKVKVSKKQVVDDNVDDNTNDNTDQCNTKVKVSKKQVVDNNTNDNTDDINNVDDIDGNSDKESIVKDIAVKVSKAPKKSAIKKNTDDTVISSKKSKVSKKVSGVLDIAETADNNNNDNILEKVPKKSRAKKVKDVQTTGDDTSIISSKVDKAIKIDKVIKAEKISKVVKANKVDSVDINTTIEDPQNINATIPDIKFNELKERWFVLCQKIDRMNQEIAVVESEKNSITSALWELGRPEVLSLDNAFTLSSSLKVTNLENKVETIKTLECDIDSSDSDNSSVTNKSLLSLVKANRKGKSKLTKKNASNSDSDTSSDDLFVANKQNKVNNGDVLKNSKSHISEDSDSDSDSD